MELEALTTAVRQAIDTHPLRPAAGSLFHGVFAPLILYSDSYGSPSHNQVLEDPRAMDSVLDGPAGI